MPLFHADEMPPPGVVIPPPDFSTRLAHEAFADKLVGDIAGSLAMLNDKLYGGYAIDDTHLRERARAVAAMLYVEYPQIVGRR